jgi:hypothetical protein
MGTDVINFRPAPEVLAWLEEATKRENRSRSNLINTVLGRITARKNQSHVLQHIVKAIHEADAQGRKDDGNYYRGGLWGAKWMLVTLLGEGIKDRALDDVRSALGLPIPHIGPLEADGYRYGTDMDAG